METKGVVKNGVKWMTVSTIATLLVGVLRLSILARFLDKEDFGIVAIITFVIGLTQTFADLGFSSAIMHKKDLTEREFSSLYWIQMIVFFSIYGIIAIFTPLISSFYGEPMLNILLPIALLDLFFWGFGKLYDTVLQKDFQFKTIAIRNIISVIISLIVAFVMAYMGCGVYSLVVSTLLHTFILQIWNFISGQRVMKVKLVLSFDECKKLVKIGVFQTGTQIIDYVAAKLDVLMIGKFLGMEDLGLYNLAKEFLSKIIQLINSIANKVVLPLFANKQDDDDYLAVFYPKIIKYLTIITFPVVLLLTVLAEPLIIIMYGHAYIAVAPITSILSLWTLFICIGNPISSIAISKGRTDLSFYYTIVRLIILFPIVIITALFSLSIVAWGQVLSAFIVFLLGYKMLIAKMLKIDFRDYVSSFSTQGIICLAVVAFVMTIQHVIPIEISNTILNVIVWGGVSLGLYGICLFLFMKKDLQIFLKQ